MKDSLRNRLPEVEIDDNNPFEGDKLGRAQYANALTSIVKAYSETGCVLAINGEWGTGKTTFVKMWLSHLRQNNYRTIYFNAWETDYVSDPLVALVGELKGIIGDNEKYREISSKIGKILVSVGKFALKQTTGIDADDIADIFKKDLEDYAEQKTTFEEFKNAIIEYVASGTENDELPVVFAIDELDRCNPHYAVKVLERVKHLFDIPNIIFVLPICKSQLEYAIQGFYGSDKIDAANYLRRFIDVEFELPAPDYKTFTEYLYNRHHFREYFIKQLPIEHESNNAIEKFKSYTEKLFRCTNMELRTMDKAFVLCRLVATQVHGIGSLDLDWIFLLCVIKLQYNDLYLRIRRHDLPIQKLLEEIESTFPRQILAPGDSHELDYHTFLFALADLLYIYNQNDSYQYEQETLPTNDKPQMNLKCSVIDAETLQQGLTHARSGSGPQLRWHSFKEIIERIDLLRII